MTWGAFTVLGEPQTQGSKTAIVRGGHAVVIEGNNAAKRQKFSDWRHAVRSEAQRWVEGQPDWGGPLTAVPVRVALRFMMPKPASAPKRRRTWPVAARSGDVDKLARCVLDALTGVLIADDSQVIDLHVTKDYGTPGLEVRFTSIGEFGQPSLPRPSAVAD